MLTAAPHVSTRRATLRAAIAPTARVAHLGSVALTVALGAVPVVVCVARGDAVVSIPLAIAGVAAGAAMGWAAEDPAAAVLASTPVSPPVRAALRSVLGAAVALAVLAIVAAIVAIGPGLPPDAGDRMSEVVATAAIAAAFGFGLARLGTVGAGAAAVTAGLVGTFLIVALAARWPGTFPTLAAGPTHTRWWIVAAVGATAVARLGRDPAKR